MRRKYVYTRTEGHTPSCVTHCNKSSAPRACGRSALSFAAGLNFSFIPCRAARRLSHAQLRTKATGLCEKVMDYALVG
jgi:hypothetical protein